MKIKIKFKIKKKKKLWIIVKQCIILTTLINYINNIKEELN